MVFQRPDLGWCAQLDFLTTCCTVPLCASGKCTMPLHLLCKLSIEHHLTFTNRLGNGRLHSPPPPSALACFASRTHLCNHDAAASLPVINRRVDACQEHVLVVLRVDAGADERAMLWVRLALAQHVGRQLACGYIQGQTGSDRGSSRVKPRVN